MKPDLFQGQYRVSSIRLPHQNYGPSGGYFVTICTQNWLHFLDDVVDGQSSLGAIIRSYKSAVTRWRRKNGYAPFAWQTRFYESIIRTNSSMDRIRRYIVNNPAKWGRDRHHRGSSSPPSSFSTSPSTSPPSSISTSPSTSPPSSSSTSPPSSFSTSPPRMV